MLQRVDDGSFDLVFDGTDLKTAATIETAIVVSLGSMSRKSGTRFSTVLQDDGWWGGPTFEGDRWGTLLQSLVPGKGGQSVALLAEQYARNALKWLVDDGIADNIDVSASVQEDLNLSITVERGGNKDEYMYNIAWSEVS